MAPISTAEASFSTAIALSKSIFPTTYGFDNAFLRGPNASSSFISSVQKKRYLPDVIKVVTRILFQMFKQIFCIIRLYQEKFKVWACWLGAAFPDFSTVFLLNQCTFVIYKMEKYHISLLCKLSLFYFDSLNDVQKSDEPHTWCT